ncbi:MAG: hypothetical protein Q8P97_02065 [bacterium]|nr:hypothetical protein [bacterium]
MGIWGDKPYPPGCAEDARRQALRQLINDEVIRATREAVREAMLKKRRRVAKLKAKQKNRKKKSSVAR